MQKLEVELEDDLTGGPAHETVQFSLDGKMFEIDLNEQHAADFRRRVAPFVEHARPVRPGRSRVINRTTASRERSRDIRAWAEQHGFAVADHGRLPRHVIEQYDSASSGEQSAEHRGRQPSARRTSASHRANAKADRSGGQSSRRRASGALSERGRSPKGKPASMHRP
jgi:nucleoid-associated protein Lsr2